MPAEHRFIVRPDLSVVEVKVNERVPYWLTELIARHNLQPDPHLEVLPERRSVRRARRARVHST